VEILDLRHFSSVDLRPLLEDEIGVWSRLLSWDYGGSADMILRYVDAKILPGYAEFAARVPLLVPRWPQNLGPHDFSAALYRKNREYEALGGWLAGVAWLIVKALWLH